MSESEVMAQLAAMERHRAEARKEHRTELSKLSDEFKRGLSDLAGVVREQNGSIAEIRLKMAREEGQREEVARAAALVKAAKEDRQKSLSWKVKVAGGVAGIAATLATAAGVLAQLIYHY
jgi:anti-sigma-K factor RskA